MKRKVALAVLVIVTSSVISLLGRDAEVYAAKIRVVSGRVQGIYPVFGSKGSMTIESNDKLYTIYTGVKTRFHPPRWPLIGDWVKVRYIIDRKGYYRAYDVYID